jgi:hypothetical protein
MSTPKKSKRFNYSLQTVLKVREIREKQEQEKFKEAEKVLQEEIKKEKEIKDFQNAKYNELTNIMSGKDGHTDLQNVIMRKSHLEVVKEQVLQQEKVKEEAEEKKEDQRKNVVKAVKDTKIIEKDKENKRKVWKKIMDKEEGKFLDDISAVAYEKKRRDALEEAGEL